MSTPSRTILGIDLGITHVTMAVFDEDGRTRVVPNADGDDATPASLHVYEADGVAIGAEARKMAAIEPENVVEDVCWRLGEADWKPEIQGRTWTAQELVGLVLRKLREDASSLRGEAIDRAVLSVPAWYDSARRHAAVDAARIAGLEILSLVNQPLAAALGVDAQSLPDDGPVIVFDLGGRDLEVTVLHKDGDTLTVRNSLVKYDLCLRAFELKIREFLVENYRHAAGTTMVEDENLAQQVVDAAHSALSTLFHRHTAATRVSSAGVRSTAKLSRAEFAARTRKLVSRAVETVDEVFASLDVGPEDAIACIAVGRGSRVPQVREALRERFGERLLVPPDPDLCLARGAALLAAVRHDKDHPGLSASRDESGAEPSGAYDADSARAPMPTMAATFNDEAFEEDEPSTTGGHAASFGLADGGHDAGLRDATTHALGLIALDRDRRERVISLIPKGTEIPCEVKGRFTYAYEGMTGVRVEVTEGLGESRHDVDIVGVVELRGLPPRPVGTPVEIVYAYGIDRILKVQVVDLDTGIRQDVDLSFRGSMTTSEIRDARKRSDTIHLD